MQEKDKNKWIEGVMGSTEGLQRAVPGASLYSKIESRLEGNVVTKIVPLRTVSLAAACILLLLIVNIVFAGRQRIVNRDNAIQTVANYYQLTNNNPLDNL